MRNMNEKIVKPQVNQSVSGSQIPEEAEKAENEALQDVSQAQDGDKVATYISENWDRPVTLRDGSYRQYEIVGVIKDDLVFKEVSKILGVSALSHTYQNELKDIAELAATWTQNDTPEILGAFLRQILRRTTFNNSDTNESKIQNLRKKLWDMWESQKTKKGLKNVKH